MKIDFFTSQPMMYFVVDKAHFRIVRETQEGGGFIRRAASSQD